MCKDPIKVIVKPDNQLLRLSCGQCGDTKDLFFEIDDDKTVSICIQDSMGVPEDEVLQNMCTPVHIII